MSANKIKISDMNISHVTLGHVDQGKSTLSTALTAIFTNEIKIFDRGEEFKRGITIDLNSVELPVKLANGETVRSTLIDAPGHADFAKNAAKGACSGDCHFILISATDGWLPQSKEHLNMALLALGSGSHLAAGERKEILKNKRIAIIINKLDLLAEEVGHDQETIDFSIEGIKDETSEVLEESGFNLDNVHWLETSALLAKEYYEQGKPAGHAGEVEAEKIKKFYTDINADIVENFEQVVSRDINSPFLMMVEKVVKTDRGAAVTGVVRAGSLDLNGTVEIIGGKGEPVQSVAISMEMFHKPCKAVKAGDNCAIILRGIKKEDVKSGYAIAQPGTIKLVKACRASVCFFTLSEMNVGERRNDTIKLGYEADLMFSSISANIKIVGMEKKTADGKIEYIMLSEKNRSNPDLTIKRGESYTLFLDFHNSPNGIVMKSDTVGLVLSSKIKEAFVKVMEVSEEPYFVTNGKKGVNNYVANPKNSLMQKLGN